MKGSLFIAIYMLTVGGSWWQQGTMTDARDGRVYKTVQIGSQLWMAENLAYAPMITYTYNHYDPNYTYSSDSSYYFCYQDSLANLKKYGALYPWKTAMKVCPIGWHLPSATEFKTLFETVGDDKKSAFKALIKGVVLDLTRCYVESFITTRHSFLNFFTRVSIRFTGLLRKLDQWIRSGRAYREA